jgi:hypothetical protein
MKKSSGNLYKDLGYKNSEEMEAHAFLVTSSDFLIGCVLFFEQ